MWHRLLKQAQKTKPAPFLGILTINLISTVLEKYPMKTITSAYNPTVKSVIKLHDKRARVETNKFLAEGLRCCSTLAKGGIKLREAYCTKETVDSAKEFTSSNNIILVSDAVIKKISTATTSSGLVCVFEKPAPPNPSELTPGVVFHSLSDPGNVGTLIRTASAMGVQSVVLVGGTDPWSPKVIQASAGTIAYTKIFEISWQELLDAKANLELCALTPRDGVAPNKEVLSNALLVVGSEAHGLPEEAINNCDKKISLTMPGETESLNAAIAGSIAMYLSIQK